ncbi:MAG: aminotransferase class V-fold PLP-dependent enzyme [Acidobacteria bacterium]|nr:aminotransferase class V-fold PLP-dependent enzyme [Acidobacteriota bacterium]
MRFPSDVVYLDHASMGIPTSATLDAISRALSQIARPEGTGTERTLEFIAAVERAREEAARLVNVDRGCIALVENTSRGLGLVASALPLKAGDNILVDDLEFLSAVLAWRGVSRRIGVEIRPVRTECGRVLPQDFERVADQYTRALVLSSVQEVNGYRCDLRAFGELAESLKAFLIVDGIQEAGIVPVDLASTTVHAYCAGGHKWLRSPLGLGFLYIHPALLELLSPPAWGYLALIEPDRSWEAYLQSPRRTPFDNLPELPDARRFSSGMPNGLGATALAQSISEIREDQLSGWGRVCEMRACLIDDLLELGLELRTPFGTADDHPSGIICFGSKAGFEAERRLYETLLENRLYVSLRYISGIGGIRVGIHFSNTNDDVEALGEIVRDHTRGSRAAVVV